MRGARLSFAALVLALALPAGAKKPKKPAPKAKPAASAPAKPDKKAPPALRYVVSLGNVEKARVVGPDGKGTVAVVAGWKGPLHMTGTHLKERLSIRFEMDQGKGTRIIGIRDVLPGAKITLRPADEGFAEYFGGSKDPIVVVVDDAPAH